MFEISLAENGRVCLGGRLDAAAAARAQEFLDQVESFLELDLQALEYISSAGLGVLLRTHKRLVAADSGLRLVNVSHHINDIFMYSGFDRLFEIHPLGQGA